MKKLNLRLLRNIKNSKGQFIAILSVIITGLLIFVAMNNASTNLDNSLEEYYKLNDFAHMYADVVRISDNKVEGVIGQKSIIEAEGRVVIDVPFITENKEEKVNVRLISVDEKQNKINKLHMQQGKRSLSSKECIIIGQFAEARGINLGDEINIQVSGRIHTLKVKGIAISPEYAYMIEDEKSLMPAPEKFGVIYMEGTFLKNISNFSGNNNNVVFKLEKNVDKEMVEDYIKEEWDNAGVSRVIKKEDQLSNSMLQEEINGLKQISKSIPIVFLVVAAIILGSMMSKNVKNDRISIGILKALGYSNVNILIHYVKYALIIGLLGGIIGTILGTGLSSLMTNLYTEFFAIPLLNIKIYPENIVVASILTAGFCSGAGLFGARGVLKISPAEAMRRETPKTGHRIILEKISFIWKKITFTWKMVIRNIFREKKKFALISLGAALTVAMMMLTFWMWVVFDQMFNVHYGEFLKMEYEISFNKPLSTEAIKDLEKIIGTDKIEPNMIMPFELSNGKESKVVNIVGINKNTKMYGFTDRYGNELKLENEGIMLSSNLATAINAKIGDNLLIKNYLPGKKDKYAEVTSIVNQSLGINAYMDIQHMSKTLTGYETINGAYINTDKNIIEELENVKNISSIKSSQGMRDVFYEFLDLMIISIGYMLVFSGILGFVIIYSMSLMSINERKMEFSSLRVLGFKKNEIFGIVLKENAVVSLLGIIYGIPLGIIFIDTMGKTIYTSDLFTLNMPVGFNQVILSIVFTVICLTAAQLATYRKINKLDFIDALKSRTT